MENESQKAEIQEMEKRKRHVARLEEQKMEAKIKAFKEAAKEEERKEKKRREKLVIKAKENGMKVLRKRFANKPDTEQDSTDSEEDGWKNRQEKNRRKLKKVQKKKKELEADVADKASYILGLGQFTQQSLHNNKILYLY